MPGKKRQQYFLIILFIALFAGGIWFLWPKVKPTLPAVPEPKREKLEINLQALENPILNELQPFEEISPLEEGIGRENPFLPI
jgi:hypothetical protein